MFFLPANHRHPAFRQGFRDMAPTATGIAAWGLMTGVAMVKSGMSVVEALAMNILVYAGSSQLAAIPLIVAGAPAWVILATGFCVNLRFVVFSLHLRDYLMHLPRWERLVHGYFTADTSYVLFTHRFPTPGETPAQRQEQLAYLSGSYFIIWAGWMSAGLAGIVLANFIPSAWGLGFAGILCLVGILCSLANTPLRLLTIVVAGASAVAAYSLPLRLNIVLAIGAAVLTSFWLERRLLAARKETA